MSEAMEKQLDDLETQLEKTKELAQQHQEKLQQLSMNALRLEGGIVALKMALSGSK